MKKVLNLVVTKKWFNMIVSGAKNEEYREIKTYWIKRLTANCEVIHDVVVETQCGKVLYRPYTHDLFSAGYGKNRPSIEKDIESISIGQTKMGLCPELCLHQTFFIIKFK